MDPAPLSSLHLGLTFTIIALTVTAYALDRWSIEIVSAVSMAALLVLFTILPLEGVSTQSLLMGFASPGLISIMALLILAQGLHRTGAIDNPVRWVIARGLKRPRRLLAGILIAAMLISAVMNNTPLVVMFIPVLAAASMKLGRSPALVMMPLSYLCILGGMTTLIGSSTNILAASAAAPLIGHTLGFFDFFVPGAVLAIVGALYVFAIIPRLVPQRPTGETSDARSGRQYLLELTLSNGNRLIGERAVAGQFKALPNVTIQMIVREGKAILPPFEDTILMTGDTLVLAATRHALTELLSSDGRIFHARLPQLDVRARTDPAMLVEAMVSPGSPMLGRDLTQSESDLPGGVYVLGIERRARMRRGELKDIRLEGGDVLLLVGERRALEGLRAGRDLVPLEWSGVELPDVEHAVRARMIFALTIALAATEALPIVVAAVAGAVAMIMAGCLNMRHAARVVDRRIVLLIAAAIAMGTALERTGGAELLAHGIVDLTESFGPYWVLSGLFLMVALVTNFLSNNATAVLFTPIAYNAAMDLGVDPVPFIHAVILGANCAFATPIGYQTNLLVMGPGNYRFGDFIKAGAPLVILAWFTFSALAPLYYNL